MVADWECFCILICNGGGGGGGGEALRNTEHQTLSQKKPIIMEN